MEPDTKIRTHYRLEFFRLKDNEVIYARVLPYHTQRRLWTTTTDIKLAYEFTSRSDARRAVKLKAFEDVREGHYVYSTGERLKDSAYFWEIVKVTSTIVTTYEEEIVSSNTPAMLRIARAVQ